MEDFYAADYSINSSGISIVAREVENILESLPADPILRRDTEGAYPVIRKYLQFFQFWVIWRVYLQRYLRLYKKNKRRVRTNTNLRASS